MMLFSTIFLESFLAWAVYKSFQNEWYSFGILLIMGMLKALMDYLIYKDLNK